MICFNYLIILWVIAVLQLFNCVVYDVKDTFYQPAITFSEKYGTDFVLAFYKEDCDHCQKFLPIYVKVADIINGNKSNRLSFYEINLTKYPDAQSKYNINYTPYVLYISKGKIISKMNSLFADSEDGVKIWLSSCNLDITFEDSDTISRKVSQTSYNFELKFVNTTDNFVYNINEIFNINDNTIIANFDELLFKSFFNN